LKAAICVILPLGLPNQNTADARPVFRAAFDNLAKWTRAENGDTPPGARYFGKMLKPQEEFMKQFAAQR
jgi:hypothetical protein